MVNQKFSGIFPAVFSPFNSDSSINYDIIKSYMEFLRKNEIRGIFLNGTSGECYSLSTQERKKLLDHWMEYKKEDFKIIVHVSNLCFQDAKELGTHALEVGADGISTMGSMYFKSNNVDGLVAECKEIALNTPELPYFYYHIPGMSGVQFYMRNFVEKAIEEIPNFSGIKFSSMDLMDFDNMSQFLRNNENITLFSGYDQLMLQFKCFGSHAAVGTTFNFAAPIYQKIWDAFENRDLENARKYQEISVKMIEVCEDTNNFIGATKYMMDIAGFSIGEPRMPIPKLSESVKKGIRTRIKERNIIKYLSKP